MRAIAVEDGQASIRYVEVPGADPPLVWIHGLICSSTGELMPAAVQPPLRGRRSLLVDLLGYGYSDKPDAFSYTLEDHAETVVKLLEALDLDRCALIGHSMGGMVATLVAAARPAAVGALVLAEPGIDPGGTLAPGIAEQTEDDFVERGFTEFLTGMRTAAAEPEGPAGRAHRNHAAHQSARPASGLGLGHARNAADDPLIAARAGLAALLPRRREQ
jgi:pimeloyl-ACP methyl ester carboxylesterase